MQFISNMYCDIIKPINKKDWRERMSSKVYAVVSKDFVKEIYDLKKKNMSNAGKAFVEDKLFGVGAYFIIDNIDYAKRYASQVNGFIFEVELKCTHTLNLLSSSKGQEQLETVLNNKLIKVDKNPFDKLIEESNIKYDSILGFMADTSSQIINEQPIYKFMTRVVCVKDYSCIKKYIKLIK